MSEFTPFFTNKNNISTHLLEREDSIYGFTLCYALPESSTQSNLSNIISIDGEVKMNLEEKKNLIHTKAQNISNAAELLDIYKNLERITIWQYHNDHKLSKLSSNYDITMLPEDFQETAKQLMEDKNFIPFLIDKMINHDSTIAYSIYKMTYETSHPELILNDGEMFLDDNLTDIYINKGGDVSALSQMNAELWLNSPILYLTD